MKLIIIISRIFHIIINEFELCKKVFFHIFIVDIKIVCFNIATKVFFNIVIIDKINRSNFRIYCINIKFLIMNFIVCNIFKCVEKKFSLKKSMTFEIRKSMIFTILKKIFLMKISIIFAIK